MFYEMLQPYRSKSVITGSSIVSMFLLDTIVCEAIKICMEKGVRPYVFQSQNVDGFDNNAIYEKFDGRVKHY